MFCLFHPVGVTDLELYCGGYAFAVLFFLAVHEY